MTAAIDITAQQRKTLIAILRRFVPGIAVWAYGSRVKWTARPNSDLDLVAFTTPAQRGVVSELKDELAESNLPFLVDLHVWEEVPERFHEIIRKEYVVVQEAKEKQTGCVMAGEWKTLPVADAPIDIIDGDRGVNYPKQEDFAPSGDCLFLNTGNVTTMGFSFNDRSFITKEKDAALRKGKLQRHDVVLTTRGTVGNVALFDESIPFDHVRINSGMVLLRADQTKLWPRFLFQFVRSIVFKEQVAALTTGSAQPQLPIRDIRKIEIPLPPLAEQKAIAGVLGALDDKIELNRRMNATLEAMARALFQSWFVDFDPVRRNKDEGGRMKDEKTAGLDNATAELFPEHFEHGEHGMLPVGWRHAAIEEVCAINAWTLGKNDDLESLEYVEISEVSRGNIGNIALYNRGEEPSRARRRLRHGDTVLSTVRPDRGSYFIALNPPENRVASTGFAVLTPTKTPWSFIHAAMTQPEVSEHLGQMADGGAYPAVRPEIIGAWNVTVPNEPKILEAFHRTAAPLFEQAEANRTQSRTLATLRDALLPKLLSGELSVTQATADRGTNG